MYQGLRAWIVEKRSALLIVAAAVLAVLSVALLSFGVWNTFYRTHEEAAILQDRQWAQAIEIEKYKAEEHRSWSRPPADAYDHYTRSEIRSWNRVLVGYDTSSYPCGTSQTPRTCTRQTPRYQNVPVYDTRHYYKVNRWKTDEWVWTRGSEQQPFFAQPPQGLSAQAVLGNRRLGDQRRGEYSFGIECDGCDEGQRVELSLEEWNRLRDGQLVTAYVNSRGTVRGIDV